MPSAYVASCLSLCASRIAGKKQYLMIGDSVSILYFDPVRWALSCGNPLP